MTIYNLGLKEGLQFAPWSTNSSAASAGSLVARYVGHATSAPVRILFRVQPDHCPDCALLRGTRK